ncbi:MAG: hypothetical protein ACK4NR_05105 [Micavibrio sp.]
MSNLKEKNIPAPNLSPYQLALKNLQDYNVLTLERKEELGVLGFSQAIPTAIKIVEHAKTLSLDSLENLPSQQKETVAKSCNEILSTFDHILKLPANQQNLMQFRNSYVAALEKAHMNFFQNTIPLFITTLNNKFSLSDTEKRIKALISNVEHQSYSLQQTVKEKLDETNVLIESIKNAAAKEGALKQALYFRGEKIYHQKRAQWWCAGIVLSTIALITYTLASFNIHNWFGIDLTGDGKEALFWQVQTTKFLIFAILAYLLVLSVRNFMAHKHNMVINSHRETALCTFEALANAANQDQGARDIILNHAAACIFTPQDTGYMKSQSNDSSTNLGNASLIVSLAKQAVGKD